MMEKKIANFKLKKKIAICSVIACIAVATIGIGLIHKKAVENSNINIAKTVEEESQAITIKTREKNSNNYIAVISEDNLEVPVPKGYVASPDVEERYVNGVNGTGVYYLTYNSDVALTPKASDTYPWTEEDGIWKSGNKGQNSTNCTLNSEDIVVGADGGVVRINASVSSEEYNDKLNITVKNKSTNVIIVEYNYSGTSYGTSENSLRYFTKEVALEQGTYTVVIKYIKDGSATRGLDTAYVKSVKLYTKGVTGEEEVQYNKRVHSGGFVIYEKLASDEGKTDTEVQATIEEDMDVAQRTRNQWVWVPIADITDMYHVSNNQLYANQYTFSESSYNKITNNSLEPMLQNESNTRYQEDYDQKYLKQYLEGISRNEFLQEMREEFYEMLTSVATYGGFYIGRYETGNTQKSNLRVVKGFTGTTSSGNANNRINFINWYNAYKRSKQMRGTSPVHTNLIWGIQWDETLKWLIDSGEKTYAEVVSDSASWGNYSGVSFTYMLTSGITTDGAGTEAGETATKSISATIIPTGSTERNKANNIYDLAGNMDEWTMEYNGYGGRCFHGGSYENDGSYYPAHYRGYGDYYPYLGGRNQRG